MSMGPLKFEFKRPALSVIGEVGSLSELIGALQEEGSALVKMFGSDMELLLTGLGETALATGVVGTGPVTGEAAGTATVETAAQRKKREKAASEAKRTETTPPAAPPPIPVGAAPDTTPNANGVPAFLDAAKTAAPPPTPPAAPTPPVPPSGVLAGKIIPHMEGIAATSPDGGQAWADWLAQSGVVVQGATFSEAMKCLRMLSDEKLKPIADALKIAA